MEILSSTSLVRDKKTKALINTNIDKYYELLRERETNNKFSNINLEITTLKVQLSNMKMLLEEVTEIIKR